MNREIISEKHFKMSGKNISRREALKIMGVGVGTIASASVLSPLASASGRIAAPPMLAGSSSAAAFEAVYEGLLSEMAAPQATAYKEKTVYEGPDIVFRQIDGHTWHGNGHLLYNESVYIVEGDDRAIVIDAGMRIERLDKIVAGITSKPVTLIATHVHPDHTGSAINDFDELYINAADTVLIPSIMGDYKGTIKYLEDGQVFDLGGREIEVIFTPGHTPGSTTFFDKNAGYGFSGDAFGSTNLLLTTNFSTLIATTSRIEKYMVKYGIEKLYPGHYSGDNCETLQRIRDEKKMSEEVLEGLRKSEPNDPASMGMGLNALIHDHGVTIRFRDPQGVK